MLPFVCGFDFNFSTNLLAPLESWIWIYPCFYLFHNSLWESVITLFQRTRHCCWTLSIGAKHWSQNFLLSQIMGKLSFLWGPNLNNREAIFKNLWSKYWSSNLSVPKYILKTYSPKLWWNSVSPFTAIPPAFPCAHCALFPRQPILHWGPSGAAVPPKHFTTIHPALGEDAHPLNSTLQG